MTIEQLEIGNKILEKIQKYKDFQKKCQCRDYFMC